jgi:hypothetical protein
MPGGPHLRRLETDGRAAQNFQSGLNHTENLWTRTTCGFSDPPIRLSVGTLRIGQAPTSESQTAYNWCNSHPSVGPARDMELNWPAKFTVNIGEA